jgi:hypothetical protein
MIKKIFGDVDTPGSIEYFFEQRPWWVRTICAIITGGSLGTYIGYLICKLADKLFH